MSPQEKSLTRSSQVRRSLDHPILDSDGHHVEYQPAVFDVLARVGGTAMVDRYKKWVEENSLFAWYGMTPEERTDNRVVRPPWWGGLMRGGSHETSGELFSISRNRDVFY